MTTKEFKRRWSNRITAPYPGPPVHEVRDRFEKDVDVLFAEEKENWEVVELQLHAERGASEAWHVWAAEKMGLSIDTGVADLREAIDKEIIRLEEENDERTSWIVKIVDCAGRQREAQEAFKGLDDGPLAHAMYEHERSCKATESAVQAYLKLCGRLKR